MVQTKRLALILLFISVYVLVAQNADVNESLLDLNQNQLEPDSLQTVLDEELEQMLREIEEPDEESIELIEVDKTEVLELIDKRRQINLANPWYYDHLGYPNNCSIYYSNFDVTGLMNEAMSLQVEGFELPSTLSSTWLYQGFLSQFHSFEHSGTRMNVKAQKYDYPVSLSRLQGSLGDYDSRYVLGSFAKGNIFGFRGLSIGFDYAMYNGYFTDLSNSGNSGRQSISYRYKDFLWNFEIATYLKESSAYEMHPSYWHLGNYKIDSRYRHSVFSFQNPWLNMAVANFSDRISSNKFANSWETDSWHIALDKSINYAQVELALRHEYRDMQRNYVSAMNINQNDYRHKSSIGLHSPHLVRLDVTGDFYDWDAFSINSSLQKDFGIFTLGAYWQNYITDNDVYTSITSPTDGTPMDAIDIDNPEESALFWGININELKVWAAVGQKKNELHFPASRYTADQSVLRLNAAYSVNWGDFSFNINSMWNYLEFDPGLLATPEYSFRSSQSIVWNLNHDNQLEAGVNVYGHSEYYLANANNPATIDASTIVDAWGAVRISKLFDFNVQFKNLLTTSLYGLYPIPLSIHAGLRWYFIN